MEEITTFRSEIATQISAMNGIFRKDVDSLDIGTKMNMLPFLVYMRGNMYDSALAS